MVLSAAIDKRRSAGCMGGTLSMHCQLSAHAKAFRMLRTDSSALFSRPKREPCAVAGTAVVCGSYLVQAGRRTAHVHHGTGLGACVVKMNVPVHLPPILSRWSWSAGVSAGAGGQYVKFGPRLGPSVKWSSIKLRQVSVAPSNGAPQAGPGRVKAYNCILFKITKNHAAGAAPTQATCATHVEPSISPQFCKVAMTQTAQSFYPP